MDWNLIFENEPQKILKIIKGKRWREEVIKNNAEDLLVFRTRQAFLRSWSLDEYIRIIIESEVKGLNDLAERYPSLYQLGRDKAYFSKKEFQIKTKIESRKKWGGVSYDKNWVNNYLSERPEIYTIKSVEQGLRKELVKAGLIEYLGNQLSSRRGEKVEARKIESISDVSTQVVKLKALICERKLTTMRKIRALRPYICLNRTDQDALRILLEELGFKYSPRISEKKIQECDENRTGKAKKGHERRVNANHKKDSTATDIFNSETLEPKIMNSVGYPSAGVTSSKSVYERLIKTKDPKKIFVIETTDISNCLNLIGIKTYSELAMKLPVVDRALRMKGTIHHLGLAN